jgi:hypothetical protein
MRMKKSSLIVVTISLSSSRGFGFAHGLLTRVATRPNGWANEMHSYFGGFTALANEFLTDLRGILKFKNTNLSPIAQAAKSLLQLNVVLALGALVGRRREQLQRFPDLLISSHYVDHGKLPNLRAPFITTGLTPQRAESSFADRLLGGRSPGLVSAVHSNWRLQPRPALNCSVSGVDH